MPRRSDIDDVLASGDRIADAILEEQTRHGFGATAFELAYAGIAALVDRMADAGEVSRDAPEIDAIETALASLGGQLRAKRGERPKLTAERAREVLREYPDADLSAFDVEGDPDAIAAEEAVKSVTTIAPEPFVGGPVPAPDVDKSGVPWCSGDDCGAYDGKRCELLGQRPDRICEPAVIDLAGRYRSAAEMTRRQVGRAHSAEVARDGAREIAAQYVARCASALADVAEARAELIALRTALGQDDNPRRAGIERADRVIASWGAQTPGPLCVGMRVGETMPQTIARLVSERDARAEERDEARADVAAAGSATLGAVSKPAKRPPGAWTPEEDPPQERFREMVLERGRELEERHGWKREVAEELGLRPDHLSRILNRTRRAGVGAMRRAAREYKIAEQYFFDTRPDRPASFRGYAATTEAEDEAGAVHRVGDIWRDDEGTTRRVTAVIPRRGYSSGDGRGPCDVRIALDGGVPAHIGWWHGQGWERVEAEPTPQDWRDAAEAGGVDVSAVPYGAAVAARVIRERERSAIEADGAITAYPPLPQRSDVVVLDETDDHSRPASPPMATVFSRFGAWVVAVGGPTRAAEKLAPVDVGHVVHIARGRRRPGIELAVRIEAATKRLPGGAIRVEHWAGAKPLPRKARAERVEHTAPDAPEAA